MSKKKSRPSESVQPLHDQDTDRAKQTDRRQRDPKAPANLSRRSFLGGVGGMAAVAVAAGVPLQPLLGGKGSVAKAAVAGYDPAARATASFDYRTNTAQAEDINIGVVPDNGDASKYTDFSGSYSKALKHDGLGVPNSQSWLSLKNALTSGKFSDFQNIIVGTPGGGPNSRENGPQGCLAFDLEGLDSHATKLDAAPTVASAQTAAEEVEHYWAALIRDVHFADYGSNSVVAEAVKDMNNLSFLKGSANNEFPFPVTPRNLFRGQIVAGDGSVQGPYVSQFLLQPTFYGAQRLSQLFQTFNPGTSNDFMTTVAAYQQVQNGGASTGSLSFDSTPRHIRDGRDLAAFTHVDVLFQTYFTAFLVLAGINAPPNPGNPYIGSNTEKAFGTFGGPDAAATLTEVATRALKASWFHKWIVNLRLRPEEYGALVQANLTKTTPVPQAATALSPDVLNSAVLPIINKTYGSFLLPQAFPEGCPTHPCYPTGHGTVGGACITVLKFFFDGSQKIQPLLKAAGSDVLQSSSDGTSTISASSSASSSSSSSSGSASSTDSTDATTLSNLTINGELSKLAFNISFGHGIHAGIHFRSSTNSSILLGEAVALSILNDRAKSYNEPFTVSITKFDGTTATITNQ